MSLWPSYLSGKLETSPDRCRRRLAPPAYQQPAPTTWRPPTRSVAKAAVEDDDEPARPLERDRKLKRLEAVLLIAREPLPTRKLSQHANLADGTEARTLIRRLNRLYDAEGRAFRVEQIAGGYQLLTRPAVADWVRRLGIAPAEVRLSAPAMETLAVVAYRQPVLRAQIEAIRGVACGEILRTLMEQDLVRIAGRSEELGRPFLYGTTRRFLQVFGLGSTEDLPRAEALRKALPLDSDLAHASGQNETLGETVQASPTKEDTNVMIVTLADSELEPKLAVAPGLLDPAEKPLVASEDFDDEELEDDDFGDDDEEDEDEEFEDEEEDGDDFEDDFDDEDDDWEEVEDEEELDEEGEDEWEEVGDDDEEGEEEEEDDEWDDEEEDEDDWDEEE